MTLSECPSSSAGSEELGSVYVAPTTIESQINILSSSLILMLALNFNNLFSP